MPCKCPPPRRVETGEAGVGVGFQFPEIIIRRSLFPEDEAFSRWVGSRLVAPGA